jgi:hypothetical protein
MSNNTIHGHNTNAGKSPEYRSWDKMIQRCMNPKCHKFASYGGRGITVCERWLLFQNFLIDMGPRPAEHTLDRIDNDGDYKPGNCRWATRSEQQRNRRANRMVNYLGMRVCVTEFAEFIGHSVAQVSWRLDHGWSAEKIATTPVRPREIFLEIDGVTRSITEWCAISPVSRNTISRRLERGMNPKDAVFNKRGNRRHGIK